MGLLGMRWEHLEAAVGRGLKKLLAAMDRRWDMLKAEYLHM